MQPVQGKQSGTGNYRVSCHDLSSPLADICNWAGWDAEEEGQCKCESLVMLGILTGLELEQVF